jgi:hypothetical protein
MSRSHCPATNGTVSVPSGATTKTIRPTWLATGPSPRAMKSRSRPATIWVWVPSVSHSLKTGPPRTDEIDFPFAGFDHVTVNARSTWSRWRTRLPLSSK